MASCPTCGEPGDRAVKCPSCGRPGWDADLAESFVGKTVLIGITKTDADDEFVEKVQMHGKIISVNPDKGITVALDGNRSGETYVLPPMPSMLTPARPGEYRLRSTGEVVVDPDLETFWVRKAPPVV